MEAIHQLLGHFPLYFLVGLISVVGLYLGKATKLIRLPAIIGYMILGVFLGPSFFSIIGEHTQEVLEFITEISLGFVALSIGIELKFTQLKKLGAGIIYIIFAESFGAFILVTSGLYLLTGNLPMSLIFGAIAPASDPAGTIAVIQEYKTKGSLTKALYAVVGFDDGLGIIIFGFAAAAARSLLAAQTGAGTSESIFHMLLSPISEIFFSIAAGLLFSVLFSLLLRSTKSHSEVLVLIFGFVLVVSGICAYFHLSLILTNMIIGIVLVNTQSHSTVQKIHNEMPRVMPLLFILFFTLAGSSLKVSVLPSLGLIGIVYILTRTAGLISGAWIGAVFGHIETKIKKYVGIGILSQAGVAIGLALIVKHEFAGLGKIVEGSTTMGDYIGNIVITTTTATCIFFEIIGPIFAKIALKKAGEIPE